jgi:hyperosmotically inducible protein
MRIAFMLALTLGLLGTTSCSNSSRPVTSADSTADTDLKQAIQSKLASDPALKQIDIRADSSRNEITLSGSVQSEEARSEAAAMAKYVRPNLIVVDKIGVQPPEVARSDDTGDMARQAREKAKRLGDQIGQSLDDAWIYSKIETRLASDPDTPALKIHVDVDQKVVTLRGEVDSTIAKQEAERLARDTEGVKEVRNLLKLKS